MSDSIQNDREAARNALLLSIWLIAAIGLLVGLLTWRIDAASASWWSSVLRMEVDLGACAVALSRPLIANSLFSILAGGFGLSMLILSLADIYTYKRSLRPYRTLLLTLASIVLVLLFIALSGDGTWRSSGRGLTRLSLGDACAASGGTTFYRIHVALLMHVFLAWIAVFGLLITRRLIVLGRDPNALSRDPNARALQVRLQQSSAARGKRALQTLRLVGCAVAAIAFITVGASLKFSITRIHHQLTWERQTATVIEAGAVCVLEIKERGGWREVSETDCTADAARTPFTRWVAENSANRRLRILPTAILEMELPRGDRMRSNAKGNFFLPTPMWVGMQIPLLQDPRNPRRLDHVFDRGQVVKTVMRLLILAISSVVIYLLWPGVPLSGTGLRQRSV